MDFITHINNILIPKITEKEVVLDLFAGCGGLSLGFEAAGYKTIGYEMEEILFKVNCFRKTRYFKLTNYYQPLHH